MKKMVNKLEAKIMKKNYLFLIAASVALAFTACSTKELDLPEEKESGVAEEMKHVSLSATTENDNSTKVTLDGTTYGWSSGVDKLMVTTTGGLVESSAFSSDGHFTLDYSGSRDGYAVIPSTFLTGYDGSNLTITYPSSYDISSYITADYLDEGKYDAAGAYLPIPMIATSNDDESKLTFYALGALVRVTVSDVPVGTKKLYITFNQTVTGNFTVTSPEPGTNSVVVADTSTPSTVEFTISADGISAEQAANSFVLYIPVPTTTGLRIASSSKTKATVARNNGYAWAVNAITCTGDGSFQTTVGTYFVAPSNLLAFNNSGVIEYSFLSGTDQLISTLGDLDNDPHKSESPYSDLENLAPGKYKDTFTWPELSNIFSNGHVPTVSEMDMGEHRFYHFVGNTLSIDDVSWQVPDDEIMIALAGHTDSWYPSNPSRNGVKAIVGENKNVIFAKVVINVEGSSYAGYALEGSSDGKKEIAGVLFFPDGYVDQTDAISYVNKSGKSWKPNTSTREEMLISYNAFEKMVSGGALFLGAFGLHTSGWEKTEMETNGGVGYYLNDMAYLKDNGGGSYEVRATGENFGVNGFANGTRLLSYSCMVRLVREKVTL